MLRSSPIQSGLRTRLSETKDLNGKPLLGTTMALVGCGMSHGHGHGNLPIVVAGGGALGPKQGNPFDFNEESKGFARCLLAPDGALGTAHYQICSRPVNPAAHMSNLLPLRGQRMGVETGPFGKGNKIVAI